VNLPLNKIIVVICTLLFWIGGYAIFAAVAWVLGAPPEVLQNLGVMIAGAAVHDAFGQWKGAL
jgi:hypothetical protein